MGGAAPPSACHGKKATDRERAAYAAGNIEEAVALAKRAAPFVHGPPAPIVLAKLRKRA
jgi:hypothetical protein